MMRGSAVAGFAAATLALAALGPMAAEEMNLVKLHVDAFTVVGIETRTSNPREMAGEGTIGKLWMRMREENLLSRIPKRVDARVVAVYSGYESDKDGPYTYLLGAKVSSAREIPIGMVARKVESGTYAMFTAAGGPPPQMVVDLWKRIWSLEKPGQIHRAYKTDFEVYYGGLSEDRANTHVDVYVGLENQR